MQRRSNQKNIFKPSNNNSLEVIVNCSPRETRIAVLQNKQLMEYRVEREERVAGSIFKGIVQNVLPGMDAAFIDIGLEKNAFLNIVDLLFEDSENTSTSLKRADIRRKKIRDLLKPGQEIMVQVVKGPHSTKGARVTTKISLPGRYVVLIPESKQISISKKIDDWKERDRLKRILESLIPEGFGAVVRTEAEGKASHEIHTDIAFLKQNWKQILYSAQTQRAPTCIHRDQTLLYRTLRDGFTEDIERIVIDDPEEYEKMNFLARLISPQLKNHIELYDQSTPIYDEYKIESELERLLQHKVSLKSGGYLVIDEMEALTAIDVNTGKQISNTSLGDAILKANMEAADEVCRQLRLRDMGGIIVIDFIDMESFQDRKQVQEYFSHKLGEDKARTRIGKISSLGLLELTRKRSGESITEAITDVCAKCNGQGRTPSKETVALWIERDMKRIREEPSMVFYIECHPEIVEVLVGHEGQIIELLEHELQREIYVRANIEMAYADYTLRVTHLSELEVTNQSYRRSQFLDCNIRRSSLDEQYKASAWTDDGYLVLLSEGGIGLSGHRARICLQEIRRSYATGEIVVPANLVKR